MGVEMRLGAQQPGPGVAIDGNQHRDTFIEQLLDEAGRRSADIKHRVELAAL